MFSTLRNRFGIPGVISVMALVFAMFGGAYAASNSSHSGKATASAKAKKGPRGPKGATGPAGPAGAQGPAGPAGAKGDAGANGSNGAAGPTGPTGVAGAKGATGATGATGFSGFTEKLPSGKTETGTWSISQAVRSELVPSVPISFPIPLTQGGGANSAFAFTQEQTEKEEFGASGCTGTIAEPTAPKGTLCVYTGLEILSENGASSGRSLVTPSAGENRYAVNGAILQAETLTGSSEATARIEAFGSWAVTAP